MGWSIPGDELIEKIAENWDWTMLSNLKIWPPRTGIKQGIMSLADNIENFHSAGGHDAEIAGKFNYDLTKKTIWRPGGRRRKLEYHLAEGMVRD